MDGASRAADGHRVSDGVQTGSVRNNGLVSELGYGLARPQGALLPEEPSSGNGDLAGGGLGVQVGDRDIDAIDLELGFQELAQDDAVPVGDEVGLTWSAALPPEHEPLGSVLDERDVGRVGLRRSSELPRLRRSYQAFDEEAVGTPDEPRADRHRGEVRGIRIEHDLLGHGLHRAVSGFRVGPQRRGLVDVHERGTGEERGFAPAVDEPWNLRVAGRIDGCLGPRTVTS